MYVDPGVLMPIASALAAIAGILMMFWRKTLGFVKGAVRAIAGVFSRSPSS